MRMTKSMDSEKDKFPDVEPGKPMDMTLHKSTDMKRSEIYAHRNILAIIGTVWTSNDVY